MSSISPSAWAFHDLLRDDIDAWVSREQHAARERGQTLLGSIFRARLAAHLGVTPRHLDRYCSGETMPDAERLEAICRYIGANRAVKHLARRCALGVYDLVPPAEATLRDYVQQAAWMLREVGEATAAAMAVDRDGDSRISPAEYRSVEHEIEGAIDALQRMQGILRARMEAALQHDR